MSDESDPLSLDPFDPANGPPFPVEFQRRYPAAQRARNQRITDRVHARGDAGVYESNTRGILDELAAGEPLELLAGDHYFTQPAGARSELAELLTGWLGQREA
ncbi:hypothetical protein ACFQE5_21170 [Pseudonocardia hispaniensis]|uniref:Alpha/beta hydrolase n=1 Tax=Pseudonocardia hispaniensis TaxID=904933 RepID=A0ABW1J783_9PSEU